MVFIPAETLSEAQSDTSSYDLDIDSVEDFNVGSLSHRNDDLFEIRETEYRGMVFKIWKFIDGMITKQII